MCFAQPAITCVCLVVCIYPRITKIRSHECFLWTPRRIEIIFCTRSMQYRCCTAIYEDHVVALTIPYWCGRMDVIVYANKLYRREPDRKLPGGQQLPRIC